ncbi:MAG: SpaA isopeptide-forming pilin-related protein [Coprobacillus cateniformis]
MSKSATDIDGNTVGNSKVIDKDGKVNFAKISEGTYYLKETVGNLPFIEMVLIVLMVKRFIK